MLAFIYFLTDIKLTAFCQTLHLIKYINALKLEEFVPLYGVLGPEP